MDKVICRIATRDPDADQGKRFVTYLVPYQDKMTVLDALFYISNNENPTLGIPRHHCKRGVCAECMLKVNGKSRLACRTLIDSEIIELEAQNENQLLKDLLADLRLSKKNHKGD